MIYKYKYTQEIYQKNVCEYEENGIVKIGDLMVTTWKPLNFNCREHNFYLRKNHEHFEAMTLSHFHWVKAEWFSELNIAYPKYNWKESFDPNTGISSNRLVTHEDTDSGVRMYGDVEDDEDEGVFIL